MDSWGPFPKLTFFFGFFPGLLKTAVLFNNMDMFNEPGNCLLLVMLTDYGKADIQMLNDENLKCCLVESMYN